MKLPFVQEQLGLVVIEGVVDFGCNIVDNSVADADRVGPGRVVFSDVVRVILERVIPSRWNRDYSGHAGAVQTARARRQEYGQGQTQRYMPLVEKGEFHVYPSFVVRDSPASLCLRRFICSLNH